MTVGLALALYGNPQVFFIFFFKSIKLRCFHEILPPTENVENTLPRIKKKKSFRLHLHEDNGKNMCLSVFPQRGHL